MRYTFFSFLFLLLLSCQKQPTIYFKENIIKELAQGDFTLPSPYHNIPLFIVIENGEYCNSNITILYHIYQEYYKSKYKSFELFLDTVLNQKMALSKKDFYRMDVQYFQLDSEISKQYHKYSFKDFMDQYCQKEDNNNYSLKSEFYDKFSNDELNTLSYYLFINNYQTGLDDYIGKYYFRPLLSYNPNQTNE
ncbi:hypothetical protein E6C50_01075 [Flavobacterium supellecticarium]|uniref:Lipoprotein n=1 Tax=Flavobacterium supellecticarium TaxID=2565924 RepID=A0A4S4A3I3_9FLAO|nr:hypothetical protein [Flavobacterium supellecticarium]THF52833.1 hypothetical protein E6C50_01075 [Flavobacterium supellecticarium]